MQLAFLGVILVSEGNSHATDTKICQIPAAFFAQQIAPLVFHVSGACHLAVSQHQYVESLQILAHSQKHRIQLLFLGLCRAFFFPGGGRGDFLGGRAPVAFGGLPLQGRSGARR